MAHFTAVLDRDAEADLSNIRAHLESAVSAAFADAFIDQVFSYFAGYSDFPYRGTMRDDVRPGVRLVGWRKILTIAFKISEPTEKVVILGVFYRGRDVIAALRGRE